MKTVLIILLIVLLLASCAAPVTKPEKAGAGQVADSTKAKKSSGLGSEIVLGSLAFLIILYVIVGPKN